MENLKKQSKTALERIMHYVERKSEFGKHDGISISDAKRAVTFAFNAGRQSVPNNVEFEWIDFGNGDWYMHTPFFDYGIQVGADSKFYIKAMGGYISTLGFDTSEEAKLFAEEDYKNRIKQALGL